MKVWLLTLLALFSMLSLRGQELNCSVQVNATQVQSTDKKIFETLQSSIFEFMNGRRWTNMNVLAHERIECSISIIVNDRNAQNNNISASLSVQVRRPVYNSTYNTVVLNFVDKDFNFKYAEFDVLEYADNMVGSNLTATLAFYAYLSMGLVFDSFSPDGGKIFFDKAQEVVNQCQSLSDVGWTASQKNNISRYWLSENMTNGGLKDIHEILYIYHRKGLDQMYDRPDDAKASILTALEKLQVMNKRRPNLLIKQVFFDAKSEELINIFAVATQDEKNKLLTLLLSLDPTRMNKYQEINKK